MAFCKKCGNELEKDDEFCTECGTPVTSKKNERKIVYDGKIHKCPSCGEVIKSFVAICPTCGFEFNEKIVANSLQKFIDKVNECEKIIAENATNENKGWSSWSKSKRFWWVVLNIFFACIPLVIYLSMPLIQIKTTPKLSKEEKQMQSLVENFPFPDDRESIIAALIFAKEKMSYISKENISRKNAYWIRLWCLKAEQLKHKADLMFPKDTIVEKTYMQILDENEKVNKKIKTKAIIGGVILVLAIFYLLVRGGVFEETIVNNTPLEIPINELSRVMPKIENGNGKIVTNNSEYFTVEYYGISNSEFEKYKQECIDFGYTIDSKNNGSLFEAYNEEGYNIRITYNDFKMNVSITDNMEMKTIIWPQTKVAKLLPIPKSDYGNIYSASDSTLIIYIGNMNIDDYNYYVNECIKKGFEKDIVQTDDHFRAKNKKGNSLSVEYRGYNTIFIRIDD